MRRRVLIGISVIEAGLAVVFVIAGWRIPRPHAVDVGFERAHDTARNAAREIHLLRSQVDQIQQSDFGSMARQLKKRTDGVMSGFRASPIDFAAVEAVGNALASSSRDIERWSSALDGDESLILLEKMNDQADRLAQVKTMPPESTPANDQSPSKHGDADTTSRPTITQAAAAGRCAAALLTIHDQCDEMERNLDSTIRQVELLNSISLPAIALGGSVPAIEMRPLWPAAPAILADLRESALIIRAFHQQLNAVAGNRLEAAPLNAGSVDERGARREPPADRLRELTAQIRKSSRDVERILRSWPAVRETMRSSARLLKISQHQLEAVLGQRNLLEHAVGSADRVKGAADELVDSYSAQFDARLAEQATSLAEMEKNLTSVADSLPPVRQTAGDVLLALRWMFWLVAALLGLHAAFVAGDACLRR